MKRQSYLMTPGTKNPPMEKQKNKLLPFRDFFTRPGPDPSPQTEGRKYDKYGRSPMISNGPRCNIFASRSHCFPMFNLKCPEGDLCRSTELGFICKVLFFFYVTSISTIYTCICTVYFNIKCNSYRSTSLHNNSGH